MSQNKKEELNEALKTHLIEAIKKLAGLSDLKRGMVIDALKDERTIINPKQLKEFCPLLFTNGVVPQSDSKILESVIKKYAPQNNTSQTFAPNKPAPVVSAPKKPRPKKT